MFSNFDYSTTFLSPKQVNFVKKLISETSETEKENIEHLLNCLFNISRYNLSNEYHENYLKAVLITLDILMGKNYLGFLDNELFEHYEPVDIIEQGEEINFNYLFKLIKKIHYSILDDGCLHIVKIKIDNKWYFGFLDEIENADLTSVKKFNFVQQIKNMMKDSSTLNDKWYMVDNKSLKISSLFVYAFKTKRKFEFLK